MPVNPQTAAAIGNAVGAGINFASTAATNSSQMNLATMTNRTQRQYALEDWNRQNEYNSPAAQMERYRKAGLNPNLIYGQQNTAQPVRSSDAKIPNLVAPQLDFKAPLEAMAAILDMSRTTQQTDNLRAQADLIKEQIRLTAANTGNRNFDLNYKTDSQDYNLEFLQQRNRNLVKDEIQKDQNIDFTKQANVRANINTNQSIKMNAERILTMRLEREKTAIGKQLLQQQITNLQQDYRLKVFEEQLNNSGLSKGSNDYLKMLIKAVDNIVGNKY